MKNVFLDNEENVVVKNALRNAMVADLVNFKHEVLDFKEQIFTATDFKKVVACKKPGRVVNASEIDSELPGTSNVETSIPETISNA